MEKILLILALAISLLAEARPNYGQSMDNGFHLLDEGKDHGAVALLKCQLFNTFKPKTPYYHNQLENKLSVEIIQN